MGESVRVARRAGSVICAGFVVLACAVVARAETPMLTVGSNGQTDACLNQQHSGASPSQSSAPGVVQVADRSCTATSGSGAPTTAAAPSASGSDGGGGGTTTNTSQATPGNRSSTTISRQAANSSSARSGKSSMSSNGTSSTARSVWAGKARGLRITHVRSKVVQLKPGKRLRVLVTLRDRQRRAVRSGIVSIGALVGAKSTLPHLRVGFTNKKGQVTFLVPVTTSMFGQRVLFRVGARTPSARALKLGTVLVPKQRAHKKAMRHIAGG